jgi:hypothetical protein
MIARYCGYRGQTIIKPGWKEISLHHRFRKVTKKDHENVVIPVSGLQDHLDRLDRTALMISAQARWHACEDEKQMQTSIR